MDSSRKIWVAVDCNVNRGMKVIETVAEHPSLRGFKFNSFLDALLFVNSGPSVLDVIAQWKKEKGFSCWVDFKFSDVPQTMRNRIRPYTTTGLFDFATVMAKAGVESMRTAVETGGDKLSIIAVTELTSLSPDEVMDLSGRPVLQSVVHLAGMAVDAGVDYLVCSGQELPELSHYEKLDKLRKFVPGITPEWKAKDNPGQKRTVSPRVALSSGADAIVIGSAIVNADDPLEAMNRTADEIEAA